MLSAYVVGSVRPRRLLALTLLSLVALAGVSSPSSAQTASTPDLGDAPDSNNSFGAVMTTPPIVARFPTYYVSGLAPTGPRHNNAPALYFFGTAITAENQADALPDADGVPNIQPTTNVANSDRADDGIVWPLFGTCQQIRVQYTVRVVGAGPYTAYFNAWADWNSNGVWGDRPTCNGTTVADEWLVQNQPLTLPGPGSYTFTTPAFFPIGPTGRPQWARITISESKATQPTGAGPGSGWRLGETEDYILR